jgi:hypothetical protein
MLKGMKEIIQKYRKELKEVSVGHKLLDINLGKLLESYGDRLSIGNNEIQFTLVCNCNVIGNIHRKQRKKSVLKTFVFCRVIDNLYEFLVSIIKLNEKK